MDDILPFDIVSIDLVRRWRSAPPTTPPRHQCQSSSSSSLLDKEEEDDFITVKQQEQLPIDIEAHESNDSHSSSTDNGDTTTDRETNAEAVSSVDDELQRNVSVDDESQQRNDKHPRRNSNVSSINNIVQERPHPLCSFALCTWLSTWSKERIRIASCGCLSSVLICTVRLLIDPGKTAYTIHSIIILFDMIIIHIFTHSWWLSFLGELIAVSGAIAFHLTHAKLFELLETTLIAAIVSFHMIISRNEHWDREKELEKDLEDLVGLQFCIQHDDRHTTTRTTDSTPVESEEERELDMDVITEVVDENDRTTFLRLISSFSVSDGKHDKIEATCLESVDEETGGRAPIFIEQEPSTVHISTVGEKSVMSGLRKVGGVLFSHFLDGSSGVMYTSFLGLIIDEVVNWIDEYE